MPTNCKLSCKTRIGKGFTAVKMPEDKPTNLSFVFRDGQKREISEHFFKLCKFLQDFRTAIQHEEAVELPLKDFDCKTFDFVTELLKYAKTCDAKSYASALKNETVSCLMYHQYLYLYIVFLVP